jgi:hypothetical protein
MSNNGQLKIKKTDRPNLQTLEAYKWLVEQERILEVLEQWEVSRDMTAYTKWLVNYALRSGNFGPKAVKVVDWETVAAALFIAYISLMDDLEEDGAFD